MKTKKVLALVLAVIMTLAVFSGCGPETNGGKVKFSIGNWPTENASGYDLNMEKLARFQANHPEFEVTTDTYAYSTQNFIAKAAAGQLPTSYDVHFTEVNQIASQGYCADIKDALKNTGILDALNPDALATVQGENGEIWGLPHGMYAQSLTINKKLFKEAGLVNEDGSIMVPQTYDEVAQYSQIIKDKTGKAGFVIPTIENCGGWHMMNVAWSYGTDFMEQNADGSWTATFNSDEFKAACQWLYDMKWKYNGLYESSTVSNGERTQLFGTYQAGMMFGAPPENVLCQSYGMDRADIMCVRMPEGPAGRYAQSGGAVIMFSNRATQEEIEACLLWYMEECGYDVVITDEDLANEEESLINTSNNGGIILAESVLPTFSNREGEDKLKELKMKYVNVDMNDWNDYLSFEDVIVQAEEPVCCQQLYSVIDGVVQKIITNPNVDIDAVVNEAVYDFQVNHLDNL